MKHWLIREKATGLWWGKRGQEIGYGDREGAIVFHGATQPDLPAFKPKTEEWVDATPRVTRTIREWCCYCGQRLHPEVARQDADWCTCCSPYEPGRDINTENEVFWTAIAHERAECAALMEVERQVREEIAIRHMVGFGRGFTASDAFLAGAPGIVVRQVTTKDEG